MSTFRSIGTTKRNKYNATKIEADGHKFDSRKEYKRYLVLKDLEDGGIIQNLRCQVPYELIPSQKVEGEKTLIVVKYIADFVYEQDGKEIVEDVKGYRGGKAYAMFAIKKKLMYYRYGIYVKEI